MKYLYPGTLSLQHCAPHSKSDNEQRKNKRQGKVTNPVLNLPGKCKTQKSIPPLKVESMINVDRGGEGGGGGGG